MEFNCTSCNHPACIMRGQGDHYCGNYMMSKPYTLKLVLGGAKGEQSIKDRVYTGNGDAVLNNHCVGSHDLTANH